MGGCVKSKTATETRQSSVRNTFIAQRVCFVLNYLWDWEPVEVSKQRSDAVSFSGFQVSPIKPEVWPLTFSTAFKKNIQKSA